MKSKVSLIFLASFMILVFSQEVYANGTQSNPLSLTSGVWRNGEISSRTAGGALWFSFRVTSGSSYDVWWNNITLSVIVDIVYQDGTSIYKGAYTNEPYRFTASRNGIVLLRVYPRYLDGTGSFQVAYVPSSPGTRSSPIRLIQDDEIFGEITSSTYEGSLWYSFNATRGVRYHVWWRDRDSTDWESTRSNYLDILVDAYYQDGTAIFREHDVSGGSTFTSDRTGTILVKVYPYMTGRTGRFRIAFAPVRQVRLD